MSELGVRYDAYEAIVCLDWFSATKAEGDNGDYLGVTGGFNWWWFAHSTSIKLQAGGAKINGGHCGFLPHLRSHPRLERANAAPGQSGAPGGPGCRAITPRESAGVFSGIHSR